MSSAAAAAASRSKLKQCALFAMIPLQPTTNAAAPRLHLFCSRVTFRPRPCEACHHSDITARSTCRLPPPCALPCTARGCCSLAKPTGRRGRRCMPLRPCSTGVHRYIRTASAYSRAAFCAIPSMPHLHPCHADHQLSRRHSTPQRSTRGIALRNNAAQVANATMNLFQETNEM